MKPLFEKLIKASDNIGVVGKDGVMEYGNRYKYLSAEKIVGLCKKALHDVGVHVYGSVVSVEELTPGSKQYRQRTVMDVSATDGTDTLTIRVSAVGMDSGDKTDGKASTYAFKYGLFRLLMIETGEEDPDKTHVDDIPDERDTHIQTMLNIWKKCANVDKTKYTKAYSSELMKEQGADSQDALTVDGIKNIINKLTKEYNAIGGTK